MEELKNLILEVFENKSENFIKSLKREFQKQEPVVSRPEMYRYRNILIYDIFKEISERDDSLFNNVDDPINTIEEVLFSYLNNSQHE